MEKHELYKTLQKMDSHLQNPTRLHIRGGAACMLHGEAYRATIDIDIIPQQSEYNKDDLAKACEKAGVLLDPISFEDLESGKPYLQLLPEETLVLPKHRPGKELTPWKGEKLRVTTPEAPDLLISKLKRCDAIDIQDIAFLILKFDIKQKDVIESFNRLPKFWKEDLILKENFENTLRDFFEEETPKKPSPCKKKKSKENHLFNPTGLNEQFA